MSYLSKIAFSVSLSLLAVVLFGLYRPKLKLSSFADDKFWLDKVFTNEYFNVVLGGDSRVYRGVNPVNLAIGLGDSSLKILNYGISSAGFSQEMLNDITQKMAVNQEKKMIVLGISPYTLTPQACINWQLHYLKKHQKEDVFLKKNIIPKYFSLFEPIAITKLFKVIAKAEEEGYDQVHDYGWKSAHDYVMQPTYSLALYKKNFLHNTVNPKVIDTLQSQIQKWTKAGITVFAYRPPTTREMEVLENIEGGFDEALTRKKIETAGAVWLDIPDRFGYQSYDGSHLSAEEANRFSLELGKVILRHSVDVLAEKHKKTDPE